MEYNKYLTNPCVLIFFYCIIIVTFLTVFVYAGEQSSLETRKFGNTSVKNFISTGINETNSKLVTVTNRDTSGNTYQPCSSKEILILYLNKKQNGSLVDIRNVFNISVGIIMPSCPFWRCWNIH